MAIRESGQVTRSSVCEVPVKGRDTMGVKFVAVKGSDKVLTIAINPESEEDEAAETDGEADSTSPTEATVEVVAEDSEQ
jgi:DNA gyrase subunit A